MKVSLRKNKTQVHQKMQYDKFITINQFSEGDVKFFHDPSLKIEKAYKFAKPFHGPFNHLRLKGHYSFVTISQYKNYNLHVF